MNLLARLFKRREPPPVQRVEFFFNTQGVVEGLDIDYIPSAGEYVFCAIAGCVRWKVQGLRHDMQYTREGVRITLTTVVLDPDPIPTQVPPT